MLPMDGSRWCSRSGRERPENGQWRRFVAAWRGNDHFTVASGYEATCAFPRRLTPIEGETDAMKARDLRLSHGLGRQATETQQPSVSSHIRRFQCDHAPKETETGNYRVSQETDDCDNRGSNASRSLNATPHANRKAYYKHRSSSCRGNARFAPLPISMGWILQA